MNRPARLVACVAFVASTMACSDTAGAQSIADRVADAPDGSVRMSYPARSGVCGDGEHMVLSGSDEWEPDCEPGPVRVALSVRRGKVLDVRTYVGGNWRPVDGIVTDLGDVSASDATRYLLGLARRSAQEVGEDAIFPTTIADGVVVWPELLAIARDSGIPTETRETATFWLGQEAAAVATELRGLVDGDDVDLEVRKAALFALSQRDEEEAISALIEVARTHDSAEIVETAMFWLSQSDDPRALALFEEILSGS